MAKKFSELIKERSILVPIEVDSKEDAIDQLIRLLYDTGKIKNIEPVIEAAHRREKQASTSIGRGVAIPHTKCEQITELCVSVGIARQEVLWDTDSGSTCKIIFFMGAPSGATGPHIQALARLARLLKTTNIIERLLKATTAEEAFRAIEEEENTTLLQKDE